MSFRVDFTVDRQLAEGEMFWRMYARVANDYGFAPYSEWPPERFVDRRPRMEDLSRA